MRDRSTRLLTALAIVLLTLTMQPLRLTEGHAAGAHYGFTAADSVAAIAQASRRYGVSQAWMTGIARCESGLNASAYNPSGASGLMQFLPSTYWAYAPRIGERRSYWNPYASALVAAYMFKHGLSGQWSCQYIVYGRAF